LFLFDDLLDMIPPCKLLFKHIVIKDQNNTLQHSHYIESLHLSHQLFVELLQLASTNGYVVLKAGEDVVPHVLGELYILVLVGKFDDDRFLDVDSVLNILSELVHDLLSVQHLGTGFEV